MTSQDPLDLTGRCAIVTGAGRGIGATIAGTLAQAGARVIIADVDGASATVNADDLRARGLDAIAHQIDVTNSEDVKQLIQFAEEQPGGLHILVNNAAISTTAIVEETHEDAWRRVIDINLTGPFLTTRAAIAAMRPRRSGKIVNVASVAAKRISYNAGASYTASKAGLVAFTRHVAYEAAPFGININAICPGPVLSPMLNENATEETRRARENSVPAGEMPTAEDQAAAILFLCSPLARMIHGVSLDVDGGSLLGWYDTDAYFRRRGAAHLLSSPRVDPSASAEGTP
jgi:NAD(P)-dependent dehydrogenase (short-subunit alcohol dehydrogenase family)